MKLSRSLRLWLLLGLVGVSVAVVLCFARNSLARPKADGPRRSEGAFGADESTCWRGRAF